MSAAASVLAESNTDSLPNARIITAAEAIREATEQALEADPRVFVMGEGARDPKGIFGTTRGLAERFGARVMEMPIAENGWTGVAIGAALMGQRPILIHQRLEFALLAMEQLVNNAAKLHYVSGGKHSVPLVVRLVVGRGWGQGPAHSQCLASMFAAIPGLKVLMPATARDAKGLLLSAVADDDPVVIIEHRWIHYATGDVPAEPLALALDGPKRLRTGLAATVVASSYMTLEALEAADALAVQGCEVDLFDLRMARPLFLQSIIASVQRTGRLVVVDTGHATLGLGAEIVAAVCGAAFSALRSAPVRIGLPGHPTPSSRSLAEVYYPRSADIARSVGGLAGLDATLLQSICDRIERSRAGTPHDVPHVSFQGPF